MPLVEIPDDLVVEGNDIFHILARSRVVPDPEPSASLPAVPRRPAVKVSGRYRTSGPLTPSMERVLAKLREGWRIRPCFDPGPCLLLRGPADPSEDVALSLVAALAARGLISYYEDSRYQYGRFYWLKEGESCCGT